MQVAAQPSLGRGHACSVFHQFPIPSGCVASGNYSRGSRIVFIGP